MARGVFHEARWWVAPKRLLSTTLNKTLDVVSNDLPSFVGGTERHRDVSELHVSGMADVSTRSERQKRRNENAWLFDVDEFDDEMKVRMRRDRAGGTAFAVTQL